MKVLGLVLAALPLVVAAVEHCEVLLRPIKHFRLFAYKAERFQNRFMVQRTIFQNQCHILLEQALEEGTAIEMLKSKSHPGWKDRDLDAQVSDYLGASQGALETIMNEILEELEKLLKRSQNLEIDLMDKRVSI